MLTPRRATAALAFTGMLLAGCGDGNNAQAQDPPDSPVDGTWALEQTQADVVEQLQEHGFGGLADRFLRAEQVWEEDNWEWEFEGGDFTARWMQPDRAWKVADYGTYEVQGDRLDLQFAETATTTTFTWAVADDELSLDWVKVNSDPLLKGIPDEAFWRAYLSEPLVRVD